MSLVDPCAMGFIDCVRLCAGGHATDSGVKVLTGGARLSTGCHRTAPGAKELLKMPGYVLQKQNTGLTQVLWVA